MDAVQLREQWRCWYSNGPPVAHVLRLQHPENWLRIHSLPEAQRYPDSPEDWTELLARHNEVATGMLGEGGRGVLIAARNAFDGEPLPEQLDNEPEPLATLSPRLLGPIDADWPGAVALKSHYDSTVGLYAVELRWHRGAYDTLLRAIANWEVALVLFVSSDSGRVYAPYDGGADLFFPNPEERDLARERYQAWLSQFPGGL
ncbi:DUF3885 domain-containing protein [Pyxidicoccus xibeiensis]|uniref:DUF3885 domain-containing protein n=1 Tax=Pyxidicoccus xibeiensis TaxID=2906759 RepID=UPI0020A72774|nr:hypothetical protein [Pyxidicoccus xibeiensis]MCP3143173.1 hypothetical protein [Pyxidicoccus xibeiensis]